MEFYTKLQRLRKEQGISQEELASQLNVSRQAVSKWENGQGFPETEKLLQISNLFGVSLDYLLKEDEPKTAEGEPDDGTYYASREMVESFLLAKRLQAQQIALGVAVLILSTCWSLLVGGSNGNMLFLLTAAVGVAILVMTGFRAKRYAPEMETRPLTFDPAYIRGLRARFETVRRNCGIAISGGIGAVILGLVVQYFLGVVRAMEGRATALFMVFVAAGVAAMVLGGCILSAWGLVAENEKHISEIKNEAAYGWVYGAILPLSVLAFLYIGFTTGAYHPGWMVIPAGALLATLVAGLLRHLRG